MKKYLYPVFLLISSGIMSLAHASTPSELLQFYEATSGKASVSRGEQFFNNKHGRDWSCASCHTAVPNKTTEHIVTGKSIDALAPSANAKRFTDQAKSEKWFKRNCKDVLARECSAQEKADVIAWLLSVK